MPESFYDRLPTVSPKEDGAKVSNVESHTYHFHELDDNQRRKTVDVKRWAGVPSTFHYHAYRERCNDKCFTETWNNDS